MARLLIALALAACAESPDGICDDANNPCRAGFHCVLGACQPSPPAACDDHAQNGSESDVDCGGSCAPCAATQKCVNGMDCASTVCVNGRCACPAGQHVSGTDCAADTDRACGPDAADCTTAFPGGTGACNSANGTCVLTSCDSGAHLCGGACAQDTSVQSCGASCTPCAAPANGSATCDGASCGIACNAGFHEDAGACAPDTNEACGSPPEDCTKAFPNGTGTCTAGACVLTACDAGFHQDGGICVSDAVTSCAGVDCTDAAHQDPHGTMTCLAGGVCGVAGCAQGFHGNSSSTACDVSSATCCGPGPGCTDCTNLFANGSGACTTAAATPNGACTVSSCNTGFHPVSNACAPNTNTACGSPPVDCTAIANAVATCDVAAGTCTVTCNTGFHSFNGGCEANTNTTCGAARTNCTTVFSDGTGVCDTASGTCAFTGCINGFHLCSGSCVSNNSVDHCGASCSACATDPNGFATCNGTSCGIACNGGFNDCNGACAPDSLSVCGEACADCGVFVGFGCVGGQCQCVNVSKCSQ